MANFTKDLNYSKGKNEMQDIQLLKRIYPNCVNVVKTNTALDKQGIDYIVKFASGSQINVDGKRRRKVDIINGYPVLALETKSVVGDATHSEQIGWTLDKNKKTDIVLYTFDNVKMCFEIPFIELRQAFEKYRAVWEIEYVPRHQPNYDGNGNISYYSECMFVPADVVLAKVGEIMVNKMGKIIKG